METTTKITKDAVCCISEINNNVVIDYMLGDVKLINCIIPKNEYKDSIINILVLK